MGAGAGHCRLTLADILTSHWNRLNCLKVRIGTPILKASYDDYGFLLMFSWVKLLWQFLWVHNVTLCNPEQVLPKLQWEGDFFIMEHIVWSHGFSEDDMMWINHCRLAFQVMTVADVLTGDGLKVTWDVIALCCRSHPSSIWDWPNESPSAKDISCWKDGLK
jgi:hypothetical protein